MSTISFQAQIVLTGGFHTDSEMKVWECTTTFVDNEGVFTGFDVSTGDVIAIDTSNYEPGTFTFFEVTAVITPDVFNPVIEITYQSINDNQWGPPDLNAVFGMPGTITRPTVNLGLLPVVSTYTQGMSDKFTEYVQNYNFVKIVDNITSTTPTFPKTNGDPVILSRGMVVYINDTDETLAKRADASSYASSHAAGLVTDTSVLASLTCNVQSSGRLSHTTAGWDALTGETGGLKAGKDYFLRDDLPGGITRTPPTTTPSCVVRIGKAISSTTLDINIEPPIAL